MKKETVELEYLRPVLKTIPLNSEQRICVGSKPLEDYEGDEDIPF